MERINVLLNEYNNLWQEKITHKQSLRKLKGYLTYLSSLLSLSLTFLGISATDTFKDLLTKNATSVASSLAANFYSVFMLISIPFTPLVILIGSFAVNDLFQIYVIGNHIGNTEVKINKLLGNQNYLSWEHAVCPVVYGGREINNNIFKNIIALSDAMIFFPIVISLCLLTSGSSAYFIYSKNKMLFWVYIIVMCYLFASMFRIGKKLYQYTKADSELSKTLASINSTDESTAKLFDDA